MNCAAAPEVDRYLRIAGAMRRWFLRHAYRGLDPYLLDQVASSMRESRVVRAALSILKPMHARIPPAIYSRCSPVLMPAVLGFVVSGNALLYRLEKEDSLLQESRRLVQILVENRSPGFEHMCWGLPFAWGENPRQAAGSPAISVTSPIGHALLDLYEVTKDTDVLGLAIDAARFLLETKRSTQEESGEVALCYSPAGRLLVHNANAMSASFLLRLSDITGDEAERILAMRVVEFVLRNQNPDGSWYYSTSSDKIDNRHTGMVLEALAEIAAISKDERVDAALRKGWGFYTGNLLDGTVPKWRVDTIYPVDILDVAQSIIVTARMGACALSAGILAFAVDNLFNGEDAFYFKLLRTGSVNRSVFIRWNQAWMYKAISEYAARCAAGNA